MFKLNDVNFADIITDGQLEIFGNLVFRLNNRVIIICSTQYGKSLVTALATLVLTCIEHLKVAIVAPSAEKAKIIMRYYVEHLGDSPQFYTQLEKDTKLERLRQEESKERITLRGGGGIFVISAQQKFVSKSIEAAMGAGSDIVIIDEANLIQDQTEATIFRMIAGRGDKSFYCKIGNPFYSEAPYSHFKKDWENPTFQKIFIDYKQGLLENRYSQEFIEEAKEKPLFDVLYACQFPSEDLIDSQGYRRLIDPKELKFIDKLSDDFKAGEDKAILGADIGGGGDRNVYCVRKGKIAFIGGSNRSNDTMSNIGEIERLMRDFEVTGNKVNLDDIGIGRGVVDRLKEKGIRVNGVSVGTPARDKRLFANLKAELYWKMKLWFDNGGVLITDEHWLQLGWIRYKENSEKQIKMESKEDLKQRTGKSPDFAEALMLTFYQPPFVGIIKI